mmetsp:Transcript_6453/g.7385  ORF Transcript_6453/g.7385 Transcript_6453/m.7385 type:complete len:82 (-) Transcript_6453:217-462(-)
MTKTHEIFFDEGGESPLGAEIGIEKYLCQGADLGGSIPAVAAVHHHWESMEMYVRCGMPRVVQDISGDAQPFRVFRFGGKV